MAEAQGQERTEAATPRRREKAREEGQVARSREVVSTCLFLTHLGFFYFAGAGLYRQLLGLSRHNWSTLDAAEVTPEGVMVLFRDYLNQTALMLLPLFGLLAGAALAANLLQTGVVFASKSLAPKPSRLNPLEGIKRIVSMQGVNELFKSLVKIGIVGYIAYATIAAALPHAFPLSQQGVADIVAFLGQHALRLGLNAAYALIALALLDYGFQRWQFEKNLRMSRQEIKEERRETDGDPQVRSRIRSLMREMARKRMMEDVPKADVVVTNPTHVAVALRYRRTEMPAPQVVAKGAGHIAVRIRDIAREHGVPRVENRAVARALYQTVDLGEFVPASLYKAVAEILAYVYRLKPPVQA